MGNYLRRLTSFLGYWLAYLNPWRTKENYKKLERANEKTENEDLKQQLVAKEQELEALSTYYNDLRIRNDEVQGLLRAKESDLEKLRMDYNDLRTRLSEMGAMQLTEGNPNITDLSDQNRPDKIAEQFSELYDNQWTDCYIVLDRLTKSEQETVETLLTILKTVYDISLNRSQMIMSDARKALLTFAGMSDEESETALDSLIQETLHKMKSYRTKHFKAVPKYIAKKINEKLVETIGEQEVTACSEYIVECVRICWLMCIKDPPMYIFCEKEDVFNKNHFMEYTEKGHRVSYVVWPVLYLYKNGPLMRKGVAQGEGKEIEDWKVSVTEDGSAKSNDFVEKKLQLSTGTRDMNEANVDDHAESKFSEKNEYDMESMQTRASLNTLDDISVPEHVSEQQVGIKDINAIVAEHNSATGAFNEDKDLHMISAVDSDVQIQIHDVVCNKEDQGSLTSSTEEGAERQVDESEKQADVGMNMQLSALTGHKAGTQQHIPDNLCLIKEQKQNVINENQEGETELADADEIQNVEDEESRNVDKHIKRWLKGGHSPVKYVPSEEHEQELSNPCGRNSNNSSNNHGDDSTLDAGAERHVDESAKQEDVEINMQLLALTGHNAGARQHIPDNLCFIKDDETNVIKEMQEGETELTDADEIETVEDKKNRDGYRHVGNLPMGVHTPVNVASYEEHDHELSIPRDRNSNNSSNNYKDDITLEVRQKHTVQSSIETSGKSQEDNSGKMGDAGISIQDNEMELEKETNDIVPLEKETVNSTTDTDAPHSLHERCEETEENMEVNVKGENRGVGDVSGLSENNVPSENDADDNNLNVAGATTDVANPTVELQMANHHQ